MYRGKVATFLKVSLQRQYFLLSDLHFLSTKMVHGKAGLRLEAQKFLLYLLVPISASLTFNDPRVQRFCADYFQFMKYPANPNTNLKKEFEELLEKKKKEDEQRKIYKEQILKLQENAQKSRDEKLKVENNKKGWLSWFRFRRSDTSS